MDSTCERVRALSAVLHPDGAIEVELSIPDQDDDVSMTIEPTKASRWLVAGNSSRTIDLEGIADEDNAKLRRMIDEYVAKVEAYIADRKARLPRAQPRR